MQTTRSSGLGLLLRTSHLAFSSSHKIMEKPLVIPQASHNITCTNFSLKKSPIVTFPRCFDCMIQSCSEKLKWTILEPSHIGNIKPEWKFFIFYSSQFYVICLQNVFHTFSKKKSNNKRFHFQRNIQIMKIKNKKVKRELHSLWCCMKLRLPCFSCKITPFEFVRVNTRHDQYNRKYRIVSSILSGLAQHLKFPRENFISPYIEALLFALILLTICTGHCKTSICETWREWQAGYFLLQNIFA